MDGWNTIVSFWDGLFLGAMLVLGRVFPRKKKMTPKKSLILSLGPRVEEAFGIVVASNEYFPVCRQVLTLKKSDDVQVGREKTVGCDQKIEEAEGCLMH